MAKTKIFRTFTDNLPTILKKVFFTKSDQNHFPRFLMIFYIFRKLSENSPRIFRKIIAQVLYQKHFPEFYNFPKFSENFETISVDVRFWFCLAAESIGQDGAILPDDQRIKLRESRAG